MCGSNLSMCGFAVFGCGYVWVCGYAVLDVGVWVGMWVDVFGCGYVWVCRCVDVCGCGYVGGCGWMCVGGGPVKSQDHSISTA